MAKALTARSVEQCKPDPKNRLEIPDGLLTGLYLLIQSSGSKSWAVRYRYEGKPRKLTLGPYPALGLGEARTSARSALQAVAEGKDPAAQKITAKREARAGRDLFENVFDEFMQRHAGKLRWASEMERMARLHVLPRWSGRRVQGITRRDVIALLDELQDGGLSVGANRVLGLVRQFFNWAISRDIVDASPVAGVKPPVQEMSRDRVLDDDEVRRVWAACAELGYPFGPLVRLLLITGQRRNEVAHMQWSELDLETRVWHLPASRSKNGHAHDIPLSDLAVETIEAVPRLADTPFVFTTTGRTPISGYSRAKTILDRTIAADGGEAVPPWILHDLRRTVATGMQRLGIPPHVTEAVLNHKSGTIKGVAAVYSRYDYADEKRAALDAWSRLLLSIVEDRAEEIIDQRNVRAMKSTRAEA